MNDAEGPRDRRRFQLDGCIGRGGFAEVYRATMVTAGGVRSEVAVKILHERLDPRGQALERLRDEGRMLGAIRHPSVVTVYDLVLLDGRIALVSEYVDGQDLEAVFLSGVPIPPRAMLEIVAKVADALHAAFHASSASGPLALVHRDVKPSNIRLGRHGEVKLLDFGVARAGQGPREAQTEPGGLVGTWLYMAPERFVDRAQASPTTDVYSLGLTLFEGLAGERIFGEMAFADRYRLALDEPRYDRYVLGRLDPLRRTLARPLTQLLYRMLDLAPTARPDPTEVAKTCRQLAGDLPGVALDRWARERDWPPPTAVGGSLEGTVVVETLFTESAPRPPPLPPEEPPPGETTEISFRPWLSPIAIAVIGACTMVIGLGALATVGLEWATRLQDPRTVEVEVAPGAAIAPGTPSRPPARTIGAPRLAPPSESAVRQTEARSAARLIEAGWALADNERDKAERMFRAAMAMSPNDDEAAHGYGYVLLMEGRTDEATKYLCRARKAGRADTRQDVAGLIASHGLQCP